MARIKALFTEHPASVGENYFQHFVSAWSFAFRMAGGTVACLVHGLLPFLFTQTGSKTIALLHDRMIVNRSRLKPGAPPINSPAETARSAGATDFFSQPG